MSELHKQVARRICCGREDGDCGSAAHVACCAGDYMDFAATMIAAVREECAKTVERRGVEIAAQCSEAMALIPKAFAIDIAATIRSQK